MFHKAMYILVGLCVLGWIIVTWDSCNTDKKNDKLKKENELLEKQKTELLATIAVISERIRVVEIENDSLKLLPEKNREKIIYIKDKFAKRYSDINSFTFEQLLGEFPRFGSQGN